MKILFLLFAATLAHGAAASAEVSSFAFTVRWESLGSDQVGRGIAMNERAKLVAVDRLLAETPEGRRLVLTRESSPTTGTEVYSLLDDATGWRAQLTDESGLRLRNTLEMGDAPLIASKWLEQEYPRVLTFEAPGLPTIELATGTRDETALQQVGFQIRADGKAGGLIRAAPAELRAAVGFLQSLLASDIGEVELFRPLLTVLAEVYGADQVHGRLPFTGTRWTSVSAGLQRGTALAQPDAVAFVKGFRAVAVEDPLSGIHTEALEAKYLAEPRR